MEWEFVESHQWTTYGADKAIQMKLLRIHACVLVYEVVNSIELNVSERKLF